MFDFAFLLIKLAGIALVVIALVVISIIIYARCTPPARPSERRASVSTPIPQAKAERILRVGYWLIAAALGGFLCIFVRVVAG